MSTCCLRCTSLRMVGVLTCNDKPCSLGDHQPSLTQTTCIAGDAPVLRLRPPSGAGDDAEYLRQHAECLSLNNAMVVTINADCELLLIAVFAPHGAFNLAQAAVICC